ncbi:hypothetical protein P3T76_005217 [Phytophthora citrophthora]|uniref:Uncharacterized protein n=1 Tax=Phytophthora citrophthora TaxID=4793 RepID=A0AAD9LPN2_9STRA|nr:hypothetical protein P3T76_005217 [Phytophthora citrophthora]
MFFHSKNLFHLNQASTSQETTMRLLLVATLPILFCVGTNAAPRSYSGSGSDADNAGQDAGVVYLPAENLRNELLNSTGLAPDSLIAVATSYEAVKDESPGLAGVATANSNVAASVLIIPTKDRVGTMTETSEITSDELSGRTQVMYNCTSAANLWNLQDDPNALKLENFQQLSNNASNDSTTPQETELREIVAIASVEFSNCATVWETAVGRPVVGNTFFSAEFSNNPVYFYTVSSSEPYTSDAGGCLLQLEMSWANLTEVYPNCKVYVQSTDLDNIIHSNATASGAEGSKNRRLEMGTYNFINALNAN